MTYAQEQRIRDRYRLYTQLARLTAGRAARALARYHGGKLSAEAWIGSELRANSAKLGLWSAEAEMARALLARIQGEK